MTDAVEVNRCANPKCRKVVGDEPYFRRYGEVFCSLDCLFDKFPGAVSVGPHPKEAEDGEVER